MGKKGVSRVGLFMQIPGLWCKRLAMNNLEKLDFPNVVAPAITMWPLSVSWITAPLPLSLT